MQIQLNDLHRQYNAYKQEIDTQIQEVIDSSQFIMGNKIKELEEKLTKFVGTKYGIGVSSGTDALLLSLMAKKIKPGDEVITTTFTFISTAEVISLLAAKPVFVDISEDTYNIDYSLIEERITNKTKGIIVVDLFGQPADYDEINEIARKYNLFVIEDAAQSFGAEYKKKKACSLAEISCTSFFPAKPLGCYGDGGMVFVDDEDLANVIRSLKEHGKGSHKYENIRIGTNARLDTLQAAILLAKFNHFPEEVEKRQKIASRYTENLKNIVITPKVMNYNISVYAQYCIRVKDRDRVQQKLKEKGISTAIYYPRPLHLQEAFSELGYKQGDFPVAEKVSQEIIALPMHPFLNEMEQDYIIDTLIEVIK